ncbi:hypothetical protein GCM10023144_02930 [Pigmentiphaga soli]|uniref:Uncharacterized protein n=1 Tax=Pigmentiphaga soli TaxID=1007095 RepID=A0ABP8GET3_9BURK
MSGMARVFDYTAEDGWRYGVWINLAQQPDTGRYDGRAQVYEGKVEDSAYVGNSLTIPPFDANSDDAAFRLALERVIQALRDGVLRTPGVLGRGATPAGTAVAASDARGEPVPTARAAASERSSRP